MELILASGSPRRRELLSLYTTDFTVCVSDFDESTVTDVYKRQVVVGVLDVVEAVVPVLVDLAVKTDLPSLIRVCLLYTSRCV